MMDLLHSLHLIATNRLLKTQPLRLAKFGSVTNDEGPSLHQSPLPDSRRRSFDARTDQQIFTEYLVPPKDPGYGTDRGRRTARDEVRDRSPRELPRYVFPPRIKTSMSAEVLPHSSHLSSPGGDDLYRYEPLQTVSFRLVRILPETQKLIRCQIMQYPVEPPPRYIAVSYTWGDPGDTRQIELNGSFVRIGINLHGALEVLRQKDDSVLVWADALCIDQQNMAEKTQQIPMMAHIYSRATSVIIWLGLEDNSDAAIDLLNYVSEHGDDTAKMVKMTETPQNREVFEAVVSLFKREYWRRLWVCQEIVHAKRVTVYCGEMRTPWEVYLITSSIFSERRKKLDDHLSGGFSKVLVSEGPRHISMIQDFVSQSDSLFEILRACRPRLVTRPQDKIFGILGLLPSRIWSKLRLDYSHSVRDIYTNIFYYVVTTTDSLDIICDAINFPVTSNLVKLPSFVPDVSNSLNDTSTAVPNPYNCITPISHKFLSQTTIVEIV